MSTRVVLKGNPAVNCTCGWMLPLTVHGFPYGREPEEQNILPRVYVALRCPQCGAGHQFLNVTDPEAPKEVERMNRKREPEKKGAVN